MTRMILVAASLFCGAMSLADAQSPAGSAIPVTADNFVRAETDMYFASFAKRGALGKFIHLRELPLHHLARRACALRIAAREPQDLERVADGRERVAQLVRERREELVLAPIGFA